MIVRHSREAIRFSGGAADVDDRTRARYAAVSCVIQAHLTDADRALIEWISH
jgi:hypothetical protein